MNGLKRGKDMGSPVYIQIHNQLRENIEKSWYDSDYVDVCTDINFVEKYIELSRLNHIKFRVLLCETEKEKPNIQNMVWNTRFIGYDYAYLGGLITQRY